MTENNPQETETTREQAIEKLIELSAQNNTNFQCYLKYFEDAIKGDVECSFISWLKDDRFNRHVKLAVYSNLFGHRNYSIAERQVDQAQTDEDLFDYLCNHLDENNYISYRNMTGNLLDLIGRLMNFQTPTKTCNKILDIALNPEGYNKYQLCSALNVFRFCYYRFYIDTLTFYKDLVGKWKKIVVETEDEDVCIEGIYYVFKKGNLEPDEYGALIEKLFDKHPSDRVTLTLYQRYLEPNVMLLAFNRLKALIESKSSLSTEALTAFSEAIASPEFLNSIDFELNNELVQFCISKKESAKDFVNQAIQNYYKDNYYKIIDIILSVYVNPESCTEVKINCLNIIKKCVRNISHFTEAHVSDTYLYITETYIRKISNKCSTTTSEGGYPKLRCAQALALLFYGINIHHRPKQQLKNSIFSILARENSSSAEDIAVRQILLYAYLALLKTPIEYQEIQELISKVRDIPNLLESYLLILCHVLIDLKCSENELRSLLSVVVERKNDSDSKIQALMQVLNEKVGDFCKTNNFEKIELLNTELDICFDESVFGTDLVFFSNLEPFEGVSLEIVLCSIPKLNEIDADEWNDNMSDKYYALGPKNKHTTIVQEFNASVDEYLSRKLSRQ